jgi:hypothetical protein
MATTGVTKRLDPLPEGLPRTKKLSVSCRFNVIGEEHRAPASPPGSTT